jgi:D-isomer specific 2-hydroxyacid dehydrogenase, NAD binding domain
METVLLCRPLHDSGMRVLVAHGGIAVRPLDRPSRDQLLTYVIDAAAVVDGLEQISDAAFSSGRLAAAGVDVLVREPAKADNTLFGLNNIVLSPHIAAAPVECYGKMAIQAAKNIVEMLDGVLDPGFVVNPETLPNRRNA